MDTEIKQAVKRAFSDITPLSNSAEVCGSIIERAENMSSTNHKNKGRIGVAAAAVAAAALAGTLTVGAVNGWDFNKAFGGVFANSADYEQTYAESSQGTADAESVMSVYQTPADFDFAKGGKQLDKWFDLDGYSLHVKGICADRHIAYVLIDAVFDEGYDYSPKDGWSDWQLTVSPEGRDRDDSAPYGMVSGFSVELMSAEDGTFSYYCQINAFDEYDWQDAVLTLDFYELYRELPTASVKDDRPWLDKESLRADVSMEIPIDFDIFAQDVERVYDREITVISDHEIDARLIKLEVSPFTLRGFIETDTSEFEKGDSYDVEFTINFKDGTSLSGCRGGTYDTNDGVEVFQMELTKPIDTSQIESVDLRVYDYSPFWNGTEIPETTADNFAF